MDSNDKVQTKEVSIMKELEQQIITHVIDVLQDYIKNGLSESVQKGANAVFNRYIASGAMVSDFVWGAYNKMFALGYPDEAENKISQKDAEILVEELTTYLDDLEKK